MNTRTENRTTLIISLLLHLLLLLFLFFEAFKNKKSVTLLQAQQKNSAQEQMLAALLPKKSDSGTQVIFDDSVILPIEEVLNEPTTQEVTAQKPQEMEAVEKSDQEKKEVETILEDKAPTKQMPKTQMPETQMPKQMSATHKPEQQEKEETIDATRRLTPEEIQTFKKLALANLIKAGQTTMKKKKKESLATCYVDHEKGNSCLIRHGANRFPGLEEMKYICYEKKIEDHIISSWKSRHGGSRIETAGKVSLTFLITHNGAVEDLSLLESSGNRNFDAKVLDCIRKTTFPPIPKHFGVKKYRPRGGYTLLPSY